jgi:hypothetical protein
MPFLLVPNFLAYFFFEPLQQVEGIVGGLEVCLDQRARWSGGSKRALSGVDGASVGKA